MAQQKYCKHILANGKRCHKRARTGSDYCKAHKTSRQRTQFRPIPKKPIDPTPQPKKEPKRKEPAEKPTALPKWVAQPYVAGKTPAFPGLRVDGNLLVAPQGIIWIREKEALNQAETLFDRLVRLLACLSQQMPLPEHVEVRLIQGNWLVEFTPPTGGGTDLSKLYDAVAAAAGFSGDLLYIGQQRTFIQYRGDSAPSGYDATGVQPRAGDELYLVDCEGTHRISQRERIRSSLEDLLLRIPPQPAHGVSLPKVAFALVVQPLYRILVRYLRDHHLHYRAACFSTSDDDTLILFEIAPRSDAPTGALVPDFVRSYLAGLPHSVVLTEAYANSGRRLLVEWGQYYPCLPHHIIDAFPPDSLLLFTTSSDFPNLCVAPAPIFFNGDELISVRVPRPRPARLTPVEDQKSLSLELPVRLAHDHGSTPSTAALILDVEEIEWVRRLLYRLPGELFSEYKFCLGKERAVLLSEGRPIESLPFGIPLRRIQDTELFIPLHTRFVPDLPWAILAQVMEIKTGVYTFLTPKFRLDVPRKLLAPLSRVLVADPGRPQVTFDLRPEPNLPPLEWTLPPQLEQQDRNQKKEGLMRRMLRGWMAPDESALPTERRFAILGRRPQESKDILREQAATYRQAGDYLGAALCFGLAGDNANAAQCYQEAARYIKNRET